MNFGYYSPYANSNPYQQLLQMQNQQQQNNNFIHVPSEDVARAYTVAPGGSVTFINDNAPYCYTKTAGMNQFDTPIFRKFRLVEETISPEQQKTSQDAQTNMVNDFISDSVKCELDKLRSRIEILENKFNVQPQNERRAKNESVKQH